MGQHQAPRGPLSLIRDPGQIGLDRSAAGQVDQQGLPVQFHPSAVGAGELVGESRGVNPRNEFRMMRKELWLRLGCHRARGEYQNPQQANRYEP